MSVINIYTDGGARGNPGPAGAGYVIYEGTKRLHQGNKYLGKKTNNQAEYLALIESVLWLSENIEKESFTKIDFYLDSELVVKQIRGEYKIKNKGLKPLYTKVKNKLSELGIPYSIVSIPRGKNKIADKLVNDAIDENI